MSRSPAHAIMGDPLEPSLRTPSLLLSLPALLQAGAQEPQALPEISPEEWQALRALVGALCTEAGTRELYLKQPRMGQGFASLDHFLEYTAKWRPGLRPLPEAIQKALEQVDISVREKPDGTSIYVTFYHRDPPDTLTYLRTIWVNGALTKLEFIKGRTQPAEPRS